MNNKAAIIKNRAGLFGKGLMGLLASLSGTLSVLSLYLADCLDDLYMSNGYYSFHSVKYLDEAVRTQVVSELVVITFICAAVFLFGLIMLCIMAGRFEHNEDGSIYMRWTDRIWTEVAFVIAAAAVAFGVLLRDPVYEIIPWQSFFKFYEPHYVDMAFFGVNNYVVLVGIAAAMFLAFMVFNGCVMSLVKRLKAGKFWENSLFGGIILKIARAFRSSEETTKKIMILLCASALLCGIWPLIPVFWALVIIFVPKIAGKFEKIRDGVEEVRSGNLTYKIEVEEDTKGIKGDLDRLAEGINDISSASNKAVQNEIRNQKMKTELISNVSHDLKTPLTSMVSYIDLLKKEGLDSSNAPSYLNIIDEKTQRLKVLTEELFEAAKASSGNMPCTITELDLAALVNQSLGEMDEKLRARGLKVIVRDDTVDSSVKADGQLLWRVVENLLSNVCKYALESSRVYVNLSEQRDTVLLEIKNISKDQLNITPDELMERFKRGDESRNTEGSGLGLAIAKDLTQLMHGVFEITVDGDLFKAGVLLPKAGAEAKEPAAKAEDKEETVVYAEFSADTEPAAEDTASDPDVITVEDLMEAAKDTMDLIPEENTVDIETQPEDDADEQEETAESEASPAEETGDPEASALEEIAAPQNRIEDTEGDTEK